MASRKQIAAREKRLRIEPLGVAKCDVCGDLAYTRWYSDLRPRREVVAYTLCKKDNDEMIATNAADRERLGLA